MRQRLTATAIIFLLAGCSANFTTAYRTFEPADGKPSSALIDAKQRALFIVPGPTGSDGKGTHRQLLVCAEPSPDALSAISSSLSASFGGLFPSGANVQAALATALSETASQLGVRNATIQLLRDGLYRQCEAYMNGLIDKSYYEQISNKYVNAMVALLAIEQLAPVSATATSIRASGGGKVSTKTSVNVRTVTPAKESNEEAAEEEPPESGSSDTSDPEANPNPDTSGNSGTSNTGTTEETELDSSGSNQASADAAAPVTSVNLPSGNQRTIPPHVSSAVGVMVTSFLAKDTVDFCLRGLLEGTNQKNESLPADFTTACKNLIQQQNEQQKALVSQLTSPAFLSIQPESIEMFDIMRRKVGEIIAFVAAANGGIDAARLKSLTNGVTSAGDDFKRFIERLPTLDRLQSFLLNDAPEAVVNEMHAVIKRP
jgi:hypothetical protein